MSKIKIKNFGPIKEGFKDADGDEWMDVKKVTVFTGNQGSGKSTVAKVISTMTWMEKAINRGDIPEPKSINDFQQHFKYQNLQGYFTEATTIEYYGDCYNILFGTKESKYPIVTKTNAVKYIVPKISYVPAERNFLSVIKNATGVRGLPETLFDFAEELKLGQNELDDEVPLPINGVSYRYDEASNSSYIIGKDFNVNLLVASSGFQSLVPLFIVSSTLAKNIQNSFIINPSNINVTQSIRLNEEITKIMLDVSKPDNAKILLVNQVKEKFHNKCFINIVEEPEQNLFPSSQHEILNSLLDFNNMNDGNKLIMTTHSPYLINYLTLAVKAGALKQKILNDNELKNRLNSIVPLSSTINPNDLAIYELEEEYGVIKKLEEYNGLPSDENELNEKLGESNELFARLLEIQQDQ